MAGSTLDTSTSGSTRGKETMTSYMIKADQWAKPEVTVGLADLVGLRIARTVFHDLHTRYGQQRESHQAQGHREVAIQAQHLPKRGYKVDRIERRCWITLTLVTDDDRNWPGLVLRQCDLPDLLAGKPVEISTEPMADIDKAYMSYEYGRLYVRFTHMQGLYRKLAIDVPREFLLSSIGKMLTKGYPRRYEREQRVFVPIQDRHRAFWSPSARLEWSDKAYDAFQQFKGRPAGYADSGRTLADLIQERLDHARNYSRSQQDVYIASIYLSPPDSFDWCIYREKDGRRVYNGGFVWRDTYYSSHT